MYKSVQSGWPLGHHCGFYNQLPLSSLLSRPVHSLMLSSHRFLCLPLCLPLCTIPCRIVLASPDDLVMCLYHFNLHLFAEVIFSSYGLMAFPILVLLPRWSCDLCTRYCGVCGNISTPTPVSFQCLLLWSTFHMYTKYGHASVWSCRGGLGYPGEYFRLGSQSASYSRDGPLCGAVFFISTNAAEVDHDVRSAAGGGCCTHLLHPIPPPPPDG